MEKITIPDYGVVNSDWLSRMLNRLSLLQQVRNDIYHRYGHIFQLLVEPNPSIEADSIYHETFANAVRAEFKKVEEQINYEIHVILSSITDAKKSDSVDLTFGPSSITSLQEEVKKFKNLENNYLSAREVLSGGDKPLAYPQIRWLQDALDKDFEREKAIFADRISHLILNK